MLCHVQNSDHPVWLQGLGVQTLNRSKHEAQEEEAASRALAMLHLQLGPVGPSRGPKGPPLPSNISGRQADSEQGAPGSRLEHRHSSQT